MSLSTTYLGLKLSHPLVVGASPLGDDLDMVKRLEDAGAAAIVLRSLFEEQITREMEETLLYLDSYGESSAEATTYFPSPVTFALGPEEYLKHVRKLKETVGIPVIASLNGATPGGWLAYAGYMQDAGADAIELNIYHGATGSDLSGAEIESGTLEMVHELKRRLRIPVAIKLGAFYTSLAQFGVELDRAGADGIVLYNRFYKLDIDVKELQVVRTLQLSDSSELPLRLRGMAALSGRVRASLAVTGGVHSALDVVKATMAGAHVTQMVSSLLVRGPDHLGRIREELEAWLEENEWNSLDEMRGNMSYGRVPNPKIYGRLNYMMLLQSWQQE